MKKKQIVVVQNNDDILGEIRFCIGSMNGDVIRRVGFAICPSEASVFLGDTAVPVIVSGNVFATGIGDGLRFAADIKSERPEALFLMYSTAPVQDVIIDAHVPKAGLERLDPARHELLARVVLAIDGGAALPDIVRFPGVTRGSELPVAA